MFETKKTSVGNWITSLRKVIGPQYSRLPQAISHGTALVKAGITSARVALLPNASHFVFKSNEAAVERERKAFLAALPYWDQLTHNIRRCCAANLTGQKWLKCTA
jgi:hypothetical protein